LLTVPTSILHLRKSDFSDHRAAAGARADDVTELKLSKQKDAQQVTTIGQTSSKLQRKSLQPLSGPSLRCIHALSDVQYISMQRAATTGQDNRRWSDGDDQFMNGIGAPIDPMRRVRRLRVV
jgi:hypothetical protein